MCHLCTTADSFPEVKLVKGTMTIHDALEKMDFCGSYKNLWEAFESAHLLGRQASHPPCKLSQWFPNLSTY